MKHDDTRIYQRSMRLIDITRCVLDNFPSGYGFLAEWADSDTDTEACEIGFESCLYCSDFSKRAPNGGEECDLSPLCIPPSNSAQKVEARFAGTKAPIHVMDREGDIYDSTSTMVENGHRFVVRCMANRVIESEDSEYHLLFDALDGLPVRYRDTVRVSARKSSRFPDQKRSYPARDGREAEVCVTATTVCVKRTRNSSKDYPATTTLNLVHVFEPNPPEGQKPVEWVLLTNEPIETTEEIQAVVSCYRQRWLIEEFFKAIKTGCAFEKRQIESYEGLKNVLAMTLPIACSMLLLRTQSRSNQDIPAKTFVDPFRLKVIRAHAKRYKLPPEPTLRDVAYAIAGLAGHLKRNGPPGWQTLSRGYERLLTLEQAWMMATQTCDQS